MTLDLNTRRNIVLALAFLAGCAASRVHWVPPALAQSETGFQRWDYHCMTPEIPMSVSIEEGLTSLLKTAGQQGWELVTVDHYGSVPGATGNYCFKRPLR
ncbi:hypothetical protein [Archangium sp.]|uniref:hypothetical protein n=1 Tax=Archangium sp. TaxID=1872627 RepID=UPI00389A9579